LLGGWTTHSVAGVGKIRRILLRTATSYAILFIALCSEVLYRGFYIFIFSPPPSLWHLRFAVSAIVLDTHSAFTAALEPRCERSKPSQEEQDGRAPGLHRSLLSPLCSLLSALCSPPSALCSVPYFCSRLSVICFLLRSVYFLFSVIYTMFFAFCCLSLLCCRLRALRLSALCSLPLLSTCCVLLYAV
jgi:hypothetical protein